MALANLTTAVNATMRAVLWEGNAYNVTVADVPLPTIINATDAIVRLRSEPQSAALTCTSIAARTQDQRHHGSLATKALAMSLKSAKAWAAWLLVIQLSFLSRLLKATSMIV
jgi:hypothetical protein